jgi:hypothetical protein
MKKTLIAISLITLSINSSTYKMSVNDAIYKNSITTTSEEPVGILCDLPMVSNDLGDTCIHTLDKVGWVNRDDSCGGLRQMVSNPNLFILRSNSITKNTSPIIPEGYRWVDSSEYTILVNNRPYNYYSQCGLTGYPTIDGVQQRFITFSDTSTSNYVTHSGTSEGDYRINDWNSTTNWLGIVVTPEF